MSSLLLWLTPSLSLWRDSSSRSQWDAGFIATWGGGHITGSFSFLASAKRFIHFLQSELFVGSCDCDTDTSQREVKTIRDDHHLFPSAGRRGPNRLTTASPQSRLTGEGRSMSFQASSPGLPRLHRGQVMILSVQDKIMNPQRNRAQTQRCTMSKKERYEIRRWCSQHQGFKLFCHWSVQEGRSAWHAESCKL